MAKADWSAKDRRQSDRIQKHGHAEARHDTSDSTFESVQIMNISAGGIRFVSSSPYEKNEACVVRLDQKERLAIVHHCKQLFKGYAIRAEFTDA